MNAGDCVEVAPANGKIFVRDSKDQKGLVIQYPGMAWRSFLVGAKKGQFDTSLL
jgi:hypothetical protein